MMLMKIFFSAIIAVIISFANFWLIHSRMKSIAPILNRWIRRLVGNIPWAVVYILLYGALVVWAIFVHAFGKNLSDLIYFLLCTVLFISVIPSWFVYKGEGGYLIGYRLIKKEDIITETLSPEPHPLLIIEYKKGSAKAKIKVRMPV